MYVAINGTFEDGQLGLEEPVPTMQKTKVVVMFLSDEKKINHYKKQFASRTA